MTIDRLIPQIEALARIGYGWEDVMVRLRIDPRNVHVVRRVVLGMGHEAHRPLSALRREPGSSEAGQAAIGATTQEIFCDDPSGARALAGEPPFQADQR